MIRCGAGDWRQGREGVPCPVQCGNVEGNHNLLSCRSAINITIEFSEDVQKIQMVVLERLAMSAIAAKLFRYDIITLSADGTLSADLDKDLQN